MYKFSIVIPVYNVEPYLTDCLESVIHQQINDIEIICIDDKSTDGSLHILEFFQNKDNRIKILRNEANRGLSYSRNRGLEAASGDYILFLDADDFLTEDALYCLSACPAYSAADLIHFNCSVVYEEEAVKKLVRQYQGSHSYQYSGSMGGREFFSRCVLQDDFDPSVWRICYKREYLQINGLRFCNGILHEDILFTFLCYMADGRVFYLEQALYVYRKRKNSITAEKNNLLLKTESLIKMYFEIFRVWHCMDTNQKQDSAIEKYLDWIYGLILSDSGNLNMEKEPAFSILTKEQRYFYHRFAVNMVISPLNTVTIQRTSLVEEKGLIIYGAGDYGRQLLTALSRCQAEVICFMVEDERGHVPFILGHKVLTVGEAEAYRESARVIVAVKHDTGEIVKQLLHQGFRDVISYRALNEEES